MCSSKRAVNSGGTVEDGSSDGVRYSKVPSQVIEIFSPSQFSNIKQSFPRTVPKFCKTILATEARQKKNIANILVDIQVHTVTVLAN